MIINGQTKVCTILGRSGTGKDSIAQALQKYGYNQVVSYTDRSKRKCEQDGREHYFISTKEIKRMIDEKEIIISTCYNGNTYYGASKKEIENKHIYVIDERGYNELVEAFGKENVLSIYIVADADVRFNRIKERSGESEAMARLEHDRTVFTNFISDYTVENNGELDVAVKEVKGIIDEFYKKDED